jgi:hypothetical protein
MSTPHRGKTQLTLDLTQERTIQLCEFWLTHCVKIVSEPEARLSTPTDLSAQCQRNCRQRGLDVRGPPAIMRQTADRLGIPKVAGRWYCIEFRLDDDEHRLQSWLTRVGGPGPAVGAAG